MTTFIRLLLEGNKASELRKTCIAIRSGKTDPKVFKVSPISFRSVPGAPFAYWVSEAVRAIFKELPQFEDQGRSVRQGMATADDFRFVRGWWEVDVDNERWPAFSKGGNYSAFYADLFLVGNWAEEGKEIKNFFDTKTGKLKSRPQGIEFYRRPGLTWPLRARKFCPQVLPADAVISVRGSGIYSDNLLFYLGLFSSKAVDLLLRMLSGREGFPQYDMGDISNLPLPTVPAEKTRELSQLAFRGWSLKRTLDSVNETSHAFFLPNIIRARSGDYHPSAIESELADIHLQIDNVAFELYGFSVEDRQAAEGVTEREAVTDEDSGDADLPTDSPPLDALLSWVVGVVFGRFDLRLATGEREAPPEPNPFDPLPAKSPGMLPDGCEPYHRHAGILIDDPGAEHDLPLLVEETLARVDSPVDQDIRRWLRKDFFKYHLQQYSRSRRKAPIYWPLATASGQYTLWVYCPVLTSQTLFTAVNDFVEPKLRDVQADLETLRGTGTRRTSEQEKQLEALAHLEDELAALRETMLRIATDYRPDQDDGVQITAAPLWPLFHHKPWQKVLKETWEKLEAGDYDWAKLAMAYWPERVQEKCVTDKSLAIAHDLEHLYQEPAPSARKTGKG